MSEEIKDILQTLDDLDVAIILAIGDSKLNHTKIQKIALILSEILGIKTDAVAYDYGGFSETIMEKLQSDFSSDIIRKETGAYALTKTGKKLYRILTKIVEKKYNISEDLLSALRTMNNKELVALTYHLFPEYTEKSLIKDEIKRLIDKCIKEGKTMVKTKKRKEGSKYIIEMYITKRNDG